MGAVLEAPTKKLKKGISINNPPPPLMVEIVKAIIPEMKTRINIPISTCSSIKKGYLLR
jgi:hypothetical protein